MITLFSTNCPKCKVLEKKLNDKKLLNKAFSADVDASVYENVKEKTLGEK